MKENKPKNSFFKKWAKRFAIFIGLTSSTLGLGTQDANAAHLIDDLQDSTKIKMEDTVDKANISSKMLERSNLEKLMAEEKQKTKISQILSNDETNISNDTQEFLTASEIEKPQVIEFKINSIENPSTEKVENVSLEDNNDIVISDVETRVKALIADSKFKILKYDPYSVETELSKEINLLDKEIIKAKNNGNTELAEELTAKYNELRNERIKLTEARQKQEVQPEILVDSPKYQAKKDITPQKLDELTSFVKNISDDWTPGQKIVNYSKGILNLEMAINGYIKNNNPDKYSALDRENYYIVLEQLLQTYNYSKQQKEILATEALKNPNNPEYKFEFPENKVLEVDIPKDNTKTGGLINNLDEVNTSSLEVKTSEANSRTGGLINDLDEVSTSSLEVETSETNTRTGGLIDDIGVQDTTFKTTSTPESYTEQELPSFKTHTVKRPLDEARLYIEDVSVGQMGIFEEEEEEVPAKKVGEVDIDKLHAGINQMGIMDEIEEDFDDNTPKTSKAKDDDDYER